MKKRKTFHYPVSPAESKETMYSINEDGWVTWRGFETYADPDTFVALSDSWGVDAEAVYVQDRRKKIDRASFRLLNPLFAVDKEAAHDWNGKIKGADPKTFEAIDSGTIQQEDELLPGIEYKGYARDKAQVFFSRSDGGPGHSHQVSRRENISLLSATATGRTLRPFTWARSKCQRPIRKPGCTSGTTTAWTNRECGF